MKKKITLAAILAIAVICGVIGYCNQPVKMQLNALALANVEALSHDEDNGQTKCPDYNYVPDHYIVATERVENVVCDKNGELQVGSNILRGSFEKGQIYIVVIEIKNCSGQAKGACCNQGDVGVKIVS